MPAPICVFAFDRPEHLRRTLTALAANDLAKESNLVIFCDGPRHERDKAKTALVQEFARDTEGFRSCNVIVSKANKGLGVSVIDGVTQMLTQYDRAIILEDDLITSPHFLRYMNDGLDLYADNPTVASIHGWCFPHAVSDPPETFFLRGTDCLGWGTWKRAWAMFEPDARLLLSELRRRRLQYAFNCNGIYDYMGMLRAVRDGKISSWAVRWRASAFLHDMHTLHPGRSLVQHVGGDGKGTNVGVTDLFDVPLSESAISIRPQSVVENDEMRGADMLFHQRFNAPPPSLCARIKKYLLPPIVKGKIKHCIKECCPPVLLRAIKKYRNKQQMPGLRWEGDYPEWQSAVAASTGYDQQTIFEKVRDAARAVRDGRALWERDSVLFYHKGYNWPLVAALMTVAARNNGRLTVMDFGGALGSTLRQHRALLGGLSFLSWNIVEQPHVVACGQEEFTDDVLAFWPDMATCVNAHPPDIILFSSVLQYMEDPYALLEETTAYSPQAIILDRTPFAESGERITVQHVSEEIYKASYPCRWLDRARVNAFLKKSYRLLPDYRTDADPPGFCGIIAMK